MSLTPILKRDRPEMLLTILQIASLADDVPKHPTALEEWSMEMLLYKVLLARKLVWSPLIIQRT